MEKQLDYLKKLLDEAIELAADREIIILGCLASGAVTYCALKTRNIDIPFFLDVYTDGKTKKYFGKPVYPVSYVNKLEKGKYFIINVFPYFEKMDILLGEMGVIENDDYTNLQGCFKSRYCDKLDPLLGFTRDDDITGFIKYGNEKLAELKIVTLGGSTTDGTYSGIKCWSEYLHEILEENGIDNVVYNGGICGYMSAQERDKFLRDVLPLEPQIVISLTGVNDIAWNHGSENYPYYSKYVFEQLINTSWTGNKYNENCSMHGVMEKLTDYENWYKNQKIIEGAAKEFLIDFRCFLQPCIFTGNYRMSDFESEWLQILRSLNGDNSISARNLFSGWNSFYKGASELIRNNSKFYDISDAFDKYSGIYIDGIHCCEYGNRLIAGKIMEIVFKNWNEKYERI